MRAIGDIGWGNMFDGGCSTVPEGRQRGRMERDPSEIRGRWGVLNGRRSLPSGQKNDDTGLGGRRRVEEVSLFDSRVTKM